MASDMDLDGGLDILVISPEKKRRLNEETATLIYQDLSKELKKRVFGVYSWTDLCKDVGEMTLLSESYIHGCVLQKNIKIPYSNRIGCLKVVVYVLKNMVEHRDKILTGKVNRNGRK